MKNSRLLFPLTAVLFLALLGTGMWLASNRPLWNDEFYTQVVNVHLRTYWQMFTGGISEGNNCPLFYAVQKAFEQLVGYRMPEAWADGKWQIYDYPSQIILRINPVLFMALAISAIFYYFGRNFSGMAAVYSLFISLSSYMVWAYWAEARPYALWVFLTTIQSLLFLCLVETRDRTSKLWRWLCGVNILLSLTVFFGMIQVVIVSFWLWIVCERNWKRYIWLAAVPVMISLFYYAQAPKYRFWFNLEPEQLVRECLSRDRFHIMLIYGFYVVLFLLQQRKILPKLFTDRSILKGLPYFGVTVSLIAATAFVLFILKSGESTGHEGFPVSSRYFIYLTPVGAIAITLLSVYLFRSFRGRWWMQLVITAGIGYLLAARLYKTYAMVKGYYGH